MGEPVLGTEVAAVGDVAIKKFGTGLDGALLRPGDEAYDNTRKIWNGMIDRRPALIARCAHSADVVRAVNFGRDHGLVLAVRGGGHSLPGHSVCDGGMMIDLSPMKGITVDRSSRTARVQAGVTWGELDRTTQAHRLAVTGGMVSHTGVAGLTLGGGHGWLMRKHGLTCDNLRSVEVVTADGRSLIASAAENTDLFWGMRGGGGNFGVATSFELQLHPLGPVFGGFVGYPFSEAGTVLRGFRDVIATAPDELRTTIAFLTSPDGHPVVGIGVCCAGDPGSGERVVQPLRRLGNAVLDQLGPMAYPEVQSMLDYGTVPGRRYYSRANLVPEVGDDLVGVLGEQFLRVPSPLTFVLAFQFGGAASRVAPEATAFPHRDAAYMLELFAAWTEPGDDERNIGWVRQTWEAVQPFLSPGNYVNTLALGEGEERVRRSYGPITYERLVALKNKYDPANLFRLNQNIKPTV